MSFGRVLFKLRSQSCPFHRTQLLSHHGRVVDRSSSPAAVLSCSGNAATKESSQQFSSGVDVASESQRRRGFFPRRAVMYVPASDQRKTKKAATLSVDTLVFDLEDGVAANQKVLGNFQW